MDTQTTPSPTQPGTPPPNKSKGNHVATIITLVVAISAMALYLVDGFNQKILAGVIGIIMLLVAIVLGYLCIKSPIGSERIFGIITFSIGAIIFIVALIIILIVMLTPEKPYAVNFNVAAGSGQITATTDNGIVIYNGEKVAEGTSITFEAIPAENVRVKSWTINGGNDQAREGSRYEVTVNEDQYVFVEFEDVEKYKITLSERSWVFGYGGERKELRIDNVGISPTGPLSVELHDDTGNAFEIILPNGSIDDMFVGKNEYFSVKPIVGLSPGTYIAEVVVSGNHNLRAVCQLTVIVDKGHGQ